MRVVNDNQGSAHVRPTIDHCPMQSALVKLSTAFNNHYYRFNVIEPMMLRKPR